MISCIEIITGYFLLEWILNIPTQTFIEWYVKYYFVTLILSLPVFAQLDARSRFQNYKQIKDQFMLYGFDKRILKPIMKSRCQRDAAILAADDTGFAKQTWLLFREAGYRWYHLFPDFVFTHPQFLLTGYFWRTTFFCPTYHSKIRSERLNILSTRLKSTLPVIQNG